MVFGLDVCAARSDALGFERDLCHPKIQNLGVAALGDKNVGRLNVAVHNAFGMSGVEGVGHLNRQAQ